MPSPSSPKNAHPAKTSLTTPRIGFALALAVASLLAVMPTRANLVLTEVDFATNTIEITNASALPFNGTQLQWCVPFTYGTLESGGFSFAAGEVRTYVISLDISATVGNDMWIYLDNTGFSTESQVTTGVIWGSNQQGNGRTNAVVEESDAWDGATDFVETITPAIPAGHTMQLKAGRRSGATSASWEIAAANLETYQLASVQANVVLTEVDFATNTIEITNVSALPFNGTQLQWCVPFSYGTLESGGFSFAAGEVRTYVISLDISATVGNDMWIYLDNTGFATESQVTTGVIWGSNQQGNGRTNAVVEESDAWDGATDFVETIAPAIPAGHTMQLKAGRPSAATSASWEVAAASLGTYQLTVAPPTLELGLKPGPTAGQVIVFWPTSTPAGAVLKKSTTLQEVVWPAEGSVPTVVGDNNEVTVSVSGAAYFRLELP